MNAKIKICAILFSALLLEKAPSAYAAGENCGWNSDHTFWSCGSGFGGTTGSSGSSINQAVESNPANLPTAPTPFGIEGTFTNRSAPAGKPKISGSTIKGFEGIGFGIGSWHEGSFSAPDLPNHFLSSSAFSEYQKYQTNPPSVLGLRLGTSVRLPKHLLPSGILIAFGGSVGLGRVSGDISPQGGVVVSLLGIGLGYSYSYERLTRLLPSINVSAFSAGMNLGVIYLGYSHIVLHSIVNQTYANVATLRLSGNEWTLFGNAKFQKDHRGFPDLWVYSGLLKKFGTIGLGYEYGVFRYSHSAVLQIYLN